jgi:hypothetical protein
MIKLCDVQRRLANICIGTSTVRGQPSGTKKIIIDYLRSINLAMLANINEKTYAAFLDRHTKVLKRRIPSCSWGIARKCLNIFLMEASINCFLVKAYHTSDAVPYLELPLDNPNAKRLIKKAKKEDQLDLRHCWTSIQYLTPENSAKLQEQAQKSAKKEECERGYLDILWWNDSK